VSDRSQRPFEAEGATIDEAIANALNALGIGREAAEVEIVQDAKRSVLGFGGQPARVRVSVRGVLDGSTPAAAAPADATTVSDDAAAVLSKLLALMDVPARVEAATGDEPGQIRLAISSEAGGLLIGRHGQTLDALEYLVNRIAGRGEDRARRVLVDAEGYRARRARELSDMAVRIAARVRQTSRAHTMNPLSPRERRIVHMALADDSSVSTNSVGEGELRRVVVSPARDTRRGEQPRRP
jgi:spoIIIJ-associated protein